MCGFGIGTIFQVAIFVVVVLVVMALLRVVFGQWFAALQSMPYWNIIQIVIGGVVAILVLLFIWRLAECARLVAWIGGPFGLRSSEYLGLLSQNARLA